MNIYNPIPGYDALAHVEVLIGSSPQDIEDFLYGPEREASENCDGFPEADDLDFPDDEDIEGDVE